MTDFCPYATPVTAYIVACAHVDAQKLYGTRAHIANCARCTFRPVECGDSSPLSPVPSSVAGLRPGLGDRIERAVKPIARAIASDCLDPVNDTLKPASPCAKLRDALNSTSQISNLPSPMGERGPS